MNAKEHEFYHAGREMYAKMKLQRIALNKTRKELEASEIRHKECIKIFEQHFKIKGDK